VICVERRRMQYLTGDNVADRCVSRVNMSGKIKAKSWLCLANAPSDRQPETI
jgi:hypothetical protein